MTRVQDVVLACLVLGLSGVAALAIWIWGDATQTPSIQAVNAQPVKASYEMSDRLPELTRAAVERPVFQPTRRPAHSEAPVAVVPQPTPVSVSLTGIVSDGETYIALMRLSHKPALQRVQIGDRLDRWTVLAIGPRGVTLIGEDGAPYVLGIGQ